MNPVELAASLLKLHDNNAVRAAAHAVVVADLDLHMFRNFESYTEEPAGRGIQLPTPSQLARRDTLRRPLRAKYEKAVAELRAALAGVPA